ncbi:hypothetical protein EX30DRAFT_145943 [Ascodesmis nigricans]|uniref:Uncharacterized protein n=1 Tax=Ascodesmis nigricans TaxID=341454 RepID=A0A4S2N1X6_9PEZI|nr:hypothetical protein EX30DRAFT_145943 [Ascodesmis nigricans]
MHLPFTYLQHQCHPHAAAMSAESSALNLVALSSPPHSTRRSKNMPSHDDFADQGLTDIKNWGQSRSLEHDRRTQHPQTPQLPSSVVTKTCVLHYIAGWPVSRILREPYTYALENPRGYVEGILAAKKASYVPAEHQRSYQFSRLDPNEQYMTIWTLRKLAGWTVGRVLREIKMSPVFAGMEVDEEGVMEAVRKGDRG